MEKKALKMTSPTGRGSGYSLLEVLITLAIIALFSGFFLLRFDDGREGELLAGTTAELRSAATLAKKRSYAFKRDHYVVFDRKRFWLTDREPTAGTPIIDPNEEAGDEVYPIPEELFLELLPLGATKWMPLNRFVWRFRDSGLSEPIGLRLTVGRSYTSLKFNALTGLAEEETFLD
ncbi:MAG: prepilin-type N-terminal cleavage/methylation domain-containing protein [Verrucomicrobiales bacterium]|nr:prepilin-type N-terminal cleavage/methylation domain-containing protein [Verrucomicrobiales bacterium]